MQIMNNSKAVPDACTCGAACLSSCRVLCPLDVLEQVAGNPGKSRALFHPLHSLEFREGRAPDTLARRGPRGASAPCTEQHVCLPADGDAFRQGPSNAAAAVHRHAGDRAHPQVRLWCEVLIPGGWGVSERCVGELLLPYHAFHRPCMSTRAALR